MKTWLEGCDNFFKLEIVKLYELYITLGYIFLLVSSPVNLVEMLFN